MSNERAEDRSGIPPPHAIAAERPRGAQPLRPEHLYKAVALAFLLLVLLHYLQPIVRVLLLVYAAAILAVALNAIVRLVPGRRGWVTAAVGLLVLAGLVAAAWFGGAVLIRQLRGLAQQWPQFMEQLGAWQEWLRQQTGLNIQLFGSRSTAFLRRVFLGSSEADVLGRAAGFVEIVALPLIVLFGAIFAVGKPNERLLTPLLRLVPGDRRLAVERVLQLLGERLLGWLKGTLLAMLLIGVLSTTAFSLLGLEYALALGTWAGITEFLPIVGPVLGGLTAVAVAFLQDPGLALWTALIVLAIQQVETNLVTPLVMSRTAEIHPFVTLFAILLFGSLFGFLGVLLALPLVLFFETVVQVLWVERAIDTDEDAIREVVEE